MKILTVRAEETLEAAIRWRKARRMQVEHPSQEADEELWTAEIELARSVNELQETS